MTTESTKTALALVMGATPTDVAVALVQKIADMQATIDELDADSAIDQKHINRLQVDLNIAQDKSSEKEHKLLTRIGELEAQLMQATINLQSCKNELKSMQKSMDERELRYKSTLEDRERIIATLQQHTLEQDTQFARLLQKFRELGGKDEDLTDVYYNRDIFLKGWKP